MIRHLRRYYEEVERLRSLGKEWNLTDDDIDKIIDESFRFLDADNSIEKTDYTKTNYGKWPGRFWKIIITLLLITVVVFSSYSYRKSVHNYVERNIHEVIYPGMKLLRRLMLPIIQTFPILTEWYDEACLVSNPYFQVSDLDCWPCESVRSILNLTTSNLSQKEYHSGIPFIFKDSNLKKVSFAALGQTYTTNKKVFDRDAPRLSDDLGHYSTAEELFMERPLNSHSSPTHDSHITWKLNRLEPTRAIRQLFGMTSQVPNYVSGAAPEKFVLIDEHNSPPYQLPSTEGSTVVMIQGSGSRLILLNPSPECQQACHRVSILLKPHHALWFNWWYWRASSMPTGTNSGISITYISSYY